MYEPGALPTNAISEGGNHKLKVSQAGTFGTDRRRRGTYTDLQHTAERTQQPSTRMTIESFRNLFS